jgi:hypothetical protein
MSRARRKQALICRGIYAIRKCDKNVEDERLCEKVRASNARCLSCIQSYHHIYTRTMQYIAIRHDLT